MKEHPILFSAPMIKAILNGSKTQTRRIIKGNALAWLEGGFSPEFCGHPENNVCPYGYAGDRIWVRETWQYYRPFAEDATDKVIYRADVDNCDQCPVTIDGATVFVNPRDRWKPSIHMPRKASRILLEVVSVRIEKLQDISEQDAIAEGVESWIETRWKSKPTHYKIYHNEPGDESTYSSTAKCSYETLWQSINGPDSWDANPWVWVVEFKRA